MSAVEYEFKYMPLVGKLSGESMLQQTEQAINEIAEIVNENTAQADIINTLAQDANDNSVEALEKATEALETSGRVYINESLAVNVNSYCESQLIYVGNASSQNLPILSKGFLEVKTNESKTEAVQIFTADDGRQFKRTGTVTVQSVGDVVTYVANYGSWTEYAPLASPAFTGNPTVPTQSTNNNSTRIASTAFVTNDLKANTMLLADTFAETIPKEADLNDYTTAGTYKSASSAVSQTLQNCPITISAFKMTVMHIGYGTASYCMQTCYTTGQVIYVRSRSGTTTWSDWKKVAYAENVLPLTGGVMTGNLTIRGNSSRSLILDAMSIERGVNPSAETVCGDILIRDKDSKQLARIWNTIGANGTNSLYFRSLKNSSDNSFCQVQLTVTTSDYVHFSPSSDNVINLGSTSIRWKQLFAGTTTIATSDERLKDNIAPISDEVLDAWGEVGWYQYQFKDSIEEKGEKARLHTGAIAQRIESVFTAHGLDANRYGLLCYDEWEAEPEEKDEDGNIVQEAREAGNRYSLRYEEALCMEAAYQRRRADRLEERIARLEALLDVEGATEEDEAVVEPTERIEEDTEDRAE